MPVEFRLLGDVEALRDGHRLVLGSARPRSVLAALLLDVNNPVSLDELTARVWGETAPDQVRSSLHSYFTRLRRALAGDVEIVRRGHGYALQANPAAIDVTLFRNEVRLARGARSNSEALSHLDSALALWRGEPFAGLDSPWLADARAALLAERESALLDQTDLRLELGQHGRVVSELEARADRHPLDERLAAQLMLALYRCGRQAQSILRFQRVRSALAEELGVDPGAALRDLYEAILRDDPFLAPGGQWPGGNAAPATGPADAGLVVPQQRTVPVPRQLPAAPRVFLGRDRELAALSGMKDASIPLSIVAGPGGVGKTSLVLHWAHEHAAHFPDGQLFVNLRGFDPAAERVSPYTAMGSLLIALGVSPAALPDDPQVLTNIYRGVLAGKRLLLVIDNASDAEQVTALLPGNAECSVLVTSRNRMTSLVASHNANLVTVDVLGDNDATALLASRLGPRRAAAEPEAVADLVTACGGLPLALSIVVGRAREHPDFSLADLVAELTGAESMLNAFDIDTNLSVRSVLSASYSALSPEQAEAFSLLGLVSGPDIGSAAAAALLGRSHADARTVLRALERASLIQQHRPGRFRMHELVRAYAAEQARERVADEVRIPALRRLAEFYLRTLVHAPEGRQPLSWREADGTRQLDDPQKPSLELAESR